MVTVRLEIPDDVLRPAEQPRHRPLLTYEEAGEVLGGVSKDAIRRMVDLGLLDRPGWTRNEVKVALVTTESVYRAAGWPIEPLAMVVPIASTRSS